MKKKIYLIRANQDKYGGAEIYLSRLSDLLRECGIEFKIINSPFPKFLPSWLRILLFNFHVCLLKSDKFYFSLDRVSCPNIYRAGDGVHKFFIEIEKKSKLNLLHPIYVYLEKKAFKNASKIIAISELVKRNIVDCYGIDKEKIEVIYNGIKFDKPNYYQAYSNISSEFELQTNFKILLFVGSGFKRKGVEEFLYIASKLKTKNFRAFIVGRDKNIQKYIKLSEVLGIRNKVFFTGPRDNVADFYAISDIFLFPTHYEPFGSVILEAMRYKNAVFTTRLCGGGELLDNYYVMENPNDSSVVQKIDSLLEDPRHLNKVKEKNYEISKNYSMEENLKLTLKILEAEIDMF